MTTSSLLRVTMASCAGPGAVGAEGKALVVLLSLAALYGPWTFIGRCQHLLVALGMGFGIPGCAGVTVGRTMAAACMNGGGSAAAGLEQQGRQCQSGGF